jgi:hydrogenase maturation protease
VHLVCDALPQTGAAAILKVIGIGNELRGDDAVGLCVARELQGSLPTGVEVVELQGDLTGLMDRWEGAEMVWLVDAVSTGAEPGTVHRVNASRAPLPGQLFGASTHHIGLAHFVELARALHRLPQGVMVYGVEAASFGLGQSLTPAVEAAAAEVAASLHEEVMSYDAAP